MIGFSVTAGVLVGAEGLIGLAGAERYADTILPDSALPGDLPAVTQSICQESAKGGEGCSESSAGTAR